MPEHAKRVLIYRRGGLGDMVVALPVLHLVRRTFAGAERRMLTDAHPVTKTPAAAAVLQGTGLVDGYLRDATAKRSLPALLRLGWHLLRFRPDVLVYLGHAHGLDATRREERLFRLFGVRRIVGLPDSDVLQRSLPLSDGSYEPEAARLARCLCELGDARLQEPESWDLHLTEAERKKGARLISELVNRKEEKRFFAFSLGTRVPANEWGVTRWRELWRKVAERYPGWGLAALGTESERKLSEEVLAQWRLTEGTGPALNLCGATTPRESAAVMAWASVFVGHDSGPAHLAAAMGTSVVGIFSARHRQRIWFPYGGHVRVIYHPVSCQGCGLEVCTVERKRCLYSISPDEVLSVIAGQIVQ